MDQHHHHEHHKKIHTKEFMAEFEKLVQEKKTFIAIFKGSEDKDGKNWCSDCVAADPAIKSTLIPQAHKKHIDVYTVEVGPREEWKDKANPLRTHKDLKIDCVPTLLFFKAGKAGNRLREGEILHQDLLEEFLNQ